MRGFKLLLLATAIAGYSLAAHAQSGDDKTLGMERQDQIERGENPATHTVAPATGRTVRAAPRVNSTTNGSTALEGSKAADRQNAVEHGENPAKADH